MRPPVGPSRADALDCYTEWQERLSRWPEPTDGYPADDDLADEPPAYGD